MNFIEELKWRGLLQDMTPETEKLLGSGKIVKGYIGFDPTADSLGVGNLVQVMTLMRFQLAGHKPIALVGGATGMVGDPSGKSAERNLLSSDILQHNLACQRKQLEKFLNFDCGETSAEIVNNYDWFKDFNFLAFIRDVGKLITVNYMMAKDSVKSRLESGMSFTEFSYQLIQGYDFYHLWKNHDVQLQMGGSDQWGNIVTGTEIIRKKAGGSAYALTTQLIKKADGTKFGKSEKGNIWLDANKTSPYAFYQFWINAGNEDVKNYIRIFSLANRETIENMEKEHDAAPHLRILQKALAQEVTTRVHSQAAFEAARLVSELMFGGKFTHENLLSLDENSLETIANEVTTFAIAENLLATEGGVKLLDLLAVHTKIAPSKAEARKAVQNNAVSVNRQKIAAVDTIVSQADLVKGKYLLVENGKKNKYIVKVQA
jgi:tyrosyl-tRNA synthetase